MDSKTTLFPGWYVKFQTAVLEQLPRPGEIDQKMAKWWFNNQKVLKRNLDSLLPLLKPLGIVSIPARSTPFIAREKFVVDTSDSAPVKISYIDDDFCPWFFEKTEESLFEPEQTLRYHKFRRASLDAPIIAELGGEEKAQTTLSELYAMLERQKNSKDGPLLTNGRVNIFYIKDASGVFRAVGVCLGRDGWYVLAYSIENTDEWGDGRVFSRSPEHSVPAQSAN